MAIRDLVQWSRGREPVPLRRPILGPSVLFEDIDSMFDRFFGELGFGARGWPDRTGGATFLPRVDVSESDTAYHVSAELPGLDEKDIEVSVHDGVLSLKGEKKNETEDKRKDYHRRELSYGSFHRVVPLPRDIEAEKVEASFKKGVLEVTIPKAASAQNRKIEVRAA